MDAGYVFSDDVDADEVSNATFADVISLRQRRAASKQSFITNFSYKDLPNSCLAVDQVSDGP